MPSNRVWIVDGHNVIFAIPGLEELQSGGLGEQARAGLTDALRRFAQRRRQKVVLVFDGRAAYAAGGQVREEFLEVVFTHGDDEEADDRIVHRARVSSESGLHVTVVTNDVHTLAVALPPGTERLAVREFWHRHVAPAAERGKRVEGDFSDIERALRESEPVAPAAPIETSLAREAGAPRRAPAVPLSAAEAEKIRICNKKARGRARQDRLLRRRRAKK